jgi:hypothetical protein
MKRDLEFEWAALPAPVADYLRAHLDRDYSVAVTYLTQDAIVRDDGRTLHGPAEVLAAFTAAAAQFAYTTEPLAATIVEQNVWQVSVHLEGNFPGSPVRQRMTFEVSGDLIVGLDISA